jgi:flagellar biosynthesis regulator FlbT
LRLGEFRPLADLAWIERRVDNRGTFALGMREGFAERLDEVFAEGGHAMLLAALKAPNNLVAIRRFAALLYDFSSFGETSDALSGNKAQSATITWGQGNETTTI